MKCEVCEVNIAVVKDYRIFDDDESRNVQKYFVCANCFNLNNHWFTKLMNAKEGKGKKIIMAKIVEGSWEDYILRAGEVLKK